MAKNGRLETTPLLDVIQIVAYTGKSGLLSVKGPHTKGLVIFERGNVVCAYSPQALPLLVKAAKAEGADERLSLRRIQVLAALRELFELAEGDYRFVERDTPVGELEGLDLARFYENGALDTGDLLLVLEKAMDADPPPIAAVTKPSPRASESSARQYPRYGPVVIKAELRLAEEKIPGYLTNLSQGGTFFHTDADACPEPKTACRVSFELPWELGRCQAKAKVVWRRSEGPDTKKGLGLAFLEFSPDSKRRVAAYLERFSELAADVDFDA